MPERSNEILLLATKAKLTEKKPPSPQLDIDTSCPFVPYGFVQVFQVKVSSPSEADAFWADCTAGDTNIDLAGASIEATSTSSILSALDVAKADIARVRATQNLEIPSNTDGGFTIENGCSSCCGRIMLFTAGNDAFYIHWHRES